jgi:hypothetical protein
MRLAMKVVLFFGAAGIALGAAWVPGATPIDAASGALPAPVERAVHAVRRCPHCGWIESKREIVPSVADPHAPQTYEYTVRMADGSSRVFQEALPTTWRLRERLLFIDGAGALD